eukprot:3077163-Rhodomonas_salina.2
MASIHHPILDSTCSGIANHAAFDVDIYPPIFAQRACCGNPELLTMNASCRKQAGLKTPCRPCDGPQTDALTE